MPPCRVCSINPQLLESRGWGKTKPTPRLALGEANPHERERGWLEGHQLPLLGLGVGGWEGGRGRQGRGEQGAS